MTNRLTKFLSYFLTFILGVAIGAGVYGIADNLSLKKIDDEFISTEQPGGLILPEETAGNGIKLVSAAIPVEQNEDYGVSAINTVEPKPYRLTATYEPDSASEILMDWSVNFKNPSSSWASGKTVTDYVTVTPTADGALTADVQCLKDFGEQIIVKVANRFNPEIYATATCDYVARISSVTLEFYGSYAHGNYYDLAGSLKFIDGETPQELSYSDTNVYDVHAVKITPEFSGAYTLQDTYKYRMIVQTDSDYLQYIEELSGLHSCGSPVPVVNIMDLETYYNDNTSAKWCIGFGMFIPGLDFSIFLGDNSANLRSSISSVFQRYRTDKPFLPYLRILCDGQQYGRAGNCGITMQVKGDPSLLVQGMDLVQLTPSQNYF